MPVARNPGATVAGRYQLARALARGAATDVWVALDLATRDEVVLKLLDPRASADEPGWVENPVERFRLEAKITAALGGRSRHVVALRDAGDDEGAPFLVLEYVRGQALDEILAARGALPAAYVAAVVEQAADALAAAHAIHVVHRDVKPSNLLVVEDAAGAPFVKVADFGLAKPTRASPLVAHAKDTSGALVAGSPAYASPEQLYAMELDGRTDLWSLAVVAYEALTGVRPFGPAAGQGARRVSGPELMVAIRTASPEPVTRRNAALPAALDGWFARALAREREARFATAGEMARALR
ncbi:MAG TPA: serine/threonine-protein kinase, partial [Minicystis sp.]|nr:serine/threonine-protein kinase [Minicystis sp.]